jgi:hypothetical protein
VTIRKRNAQDFLKFLAQNNHINACIEIKYMKTNLTDMEVSNSVATVMTDVFQKN